MKGMVPVRGYQRPAGNQHDDGDGFKQVLKQITPLTKVGAVCFVIGKLTGVLAIPAVFIPSLNALALPLIICWGSFVFTTIILCSVDHFVVRKRRVTAEHARAEEIQTWLMENPDLREQIMAEIEQHRTQDQETEKVIALSNYRD